jgi:uncharacterized protein
MLVLAVAFSVLALAVGPVLVGRSRGEGAVHGIAHVLAHLVAPAVVVAGVVPHLYAEIGALGPGLVALGYAASWLAERNGERPVSFATVVILPALVVHSLVDGASLALASRSAVGLAPCLLVLALAAHRLPEGVFLGRALLPHVGAAGTAACVCVLAAATVVGAAVGGRALDRLGDGGSHAIVAAGVGAILRSLVHRRTARAS